jgi:hypothetical protein
MQSVLAEKIDEQSEELNSGTEPDVETELARARPDPSFHMTLFVISTAVILLSLLLRVEGERQVVVPLVDLPLPEVCTSQRLLGLDCLGCGLTRSFISIGHGDLLAAWRFNPAGLLGFVIMAAQIPWRAAQWIRIRRGLPELQLKLVGSFLLGTFAAVLLVQWLVRMAF